MKSLKPKKKLLFFLWNFWEYSEHWIIFIQKKFWIFFFWTLIFFQYFCFIRNFSGSQDDLVPFRCGLDQSIDSYYHTLQLDTQEPVEDPWAFDYLMSSANKDQTWADIKTMAHSLLAEVREYVEESTADIQRIRSVFFSS